MGIDSALSLIDSELKRGGVVTRMPLGAELPAEALNAQDHRDLASPTALERARAMRAIADRLAGEQAGVMDAVSGSPFPVQMGGRGYLLHRTTGPHGHSGPEAFTAG